VVTYGGDAGDRTFKVLHRPKGGTGDDIRANVNAVVEGVLLGSEE